MGEADWVPGVTQNVQFQLLKECLNNFHCNFFIAHVIVIVHFVCIIIIICICEVVLQSHKFFYYIKGDYN